MAMPWHRTRPAVPRVREPAVSVGDLIHQLQDAVDRLNDETGRLEQAIPDPKPREGKPREPPALVAPRRPPGLPGRLRFG